MMRCSERGGQEVAMPPLESQLIYSNWRTWLLAGAGQADGNMQNCPLMGLLRGKGGQHPIHISLYVCEALVPL